MTKLSIHIGTHKTGSSTIQHAIRSSSEAMVSEGWRHIPAPAGILRQMMVASQYSQALADSLRKYLLKEAKSQLPQDRYVLSYEGLSGDPRRGYVNSEVVAKMLRYATKDFQTKVVVYLRRQDDWSESMYTQTVHEGSVESFESFLHSLMVPGALDYTRFLLGYEAMFGEENIAVRSYHSASSLGILDDFSSYLGIQKLCSQAHKSRSNQSYSMAALEIAKRVNPELNKAQRKLLRGVLQLALPKPSGQNFAYFSREARSNFLLQFDDTNRQVATKYFDGDLDRLFPRPNLGSAGVDSAPHAVAVDDVALVVLSIMKAHGRQSGVSGLIRRALSRTPRLKLAIRKLLFSESR